MPKNLRARFFFVPCSGVSHLIAGFLFAGVLSCHLISAAPNSNETGPNMTGVTDPLKGPHFLLQEDDVMVLEVNQPVVGNSNLATSLLVLDTANSTFQPQQSFNLSNSNTEFNSYSPGSVPGSTATGRMYNSTGDVVITISPDQKDANNVAWLINFWDPLTNSKQSQFVNSQLQPNGASIYSRVVMGDFNGDALSDALIFVESDFPGSKLWGMNILTAAEVTQVDSLKQGPQIPADATTGQLLPLMNSIVVGDFNGAGRDGIAALLSDNQTIQFYSVDPATFAITASSSYKLPAPLTAATLAAGRFRNTLNSELVVIGTAQDGSDATWIYSVQTMATVNNASVFQPSVVQTYKEPVSNGYSYAHYNIPLNAVFAQAAPILTWSQGSSQQLVLGLQYVYGQPANNTNNTGFVWIGSFDSSFQFYLDAYTDVLSGNGCLVGMQVGNFDNQSDGAHNPNLQLALFENQGGGNAKCTPNFDNGYLHVKIVNITAPENFNPLNTTEPTNWLTDATDIVPSFPLGYNALQLVSLSTGDLQGRSKRLGAPDIVRIPTQIQPKVILGTPPMHVDYITPDDPSQCLNPPDALGRCIDNLTVIPSAPATTISPFATEFDFTTGSAKNAQSQTRTSWGLSVKTSEEAKISFNDLEESASVDIKDSASSLFQNSISQQYDSYGGHQDSLKVTTGLADQLLYTLKEMNVYYYPVLGEKGSNGNQVYLEFSIPDSVVHVDADASSLEWYQPVQEPGNILSYPWGSDQLQAGFGNSLQMLTENPTCQATDDSGSTFSASWTVKQQNGTSTGTVSAFSNDLSISTSEGAGVSGVDGASISTSLDIGTSSSLNTLNVETQTLNASQGIKVTKPGFFNLDNGQYSFAGYVFGESNPANAQPWQNITPPNANEISTGPIFAGFVADPVTNRTGSSCDGAVSGSWWTQTDTYNGAPDVGLNHPSRWKWNPQASPNPAQDVSFYAPDPSDPIGSRFYWMKGFFITKAGDPLTGPSLSDATLGDNLTLTVRVYNYSLVDTNASTLAHPAQSIHVSFYGQQYCTNGTLCGNAFEIGSTTIASIPGFKSQSTPAASQPNWALASVNFNTNGYPNLANTNLVFWVVTWMEDANGNLVTEIPGHGLTSIPGSLTAISQVPIETYSNNVGMYGVHSQFFIAPASAPGAIRPSTGEIKSIRLFGPSHATLNDDVHLKTRVRTADGPVDSLTLEYFDGAPGNGDLFDDQRIRHIDANGAFVHATSYTARSCGLHTLYAEAFTVGGAQVISKGFDIDVTIDTVGWIEGMIQYVAKLSLREWQRRQLRLELLAAREAFEQHRLHHGIELLEQFARTVEGIQGACRAQIKDQLARLIGEVQTVKGCEKSMAAAR